MWVYTSAESLSLWARLQTVTSISKINILNPVKSFFSIIAFLLIAAGFFLLIRFEISFGVAGGRFGGAEVINMPGTFWFFIAIQTFWGLSMVADAIKEIWKLLHRNIDKSDEDGPTIIISIYWLLATLFFLIINCLAIWAAIEMLLNLYKLLGDYEMPEKAILGGLFLLSFAVFCYLYYVFLFRSLIEIFFPKARISWQLLRKNNNQLK